MIRVTNSIALRFDVIGKTLETLMDKQLMKTTVNNELSSKKYAGKKRCFEIGKLLIIPLKTFFGDTLGGRICICVLQQADTITSNHAP
jgi:hypothetical protein